MPFRLTVGNPPYPFERVEGPDIWAVICEIGDDPERGLAYFVSVELTPFGDQTFEYVFRVFERDREHGVNTRSFSSGLQTEAIFSRSDRSAILDVIALATIELLNWRRPHRVDRCTTDANLPQRALRKHNRISLAFRQCGYWVAEAGEFYGQKQWLAERID